MSAPIEWTDGPSGQSGPVVDEPWREGESCAHQIRASRTGKNCPVCRQTLPEVEIRALSAEQSVAALPASCPHCDEAMNRGQLRRHELICPRAPATCVSEARRLLRLVHRSIHWCVLLVHSSIRSVHSFVYSSALRRGMQVDGIERGSSQARVDMRLG